VPTVFWLGVSDGALSGLAWVGLVLALALLAGFANAPLLLALWAIYMSFVHVGQIFYGYGWETLLLETTFLAVFVAPAWDPRPFPPRQPPSVVVIVLLRWLAFRLMLGAGLIKLRGDPCWRDLTCLVYHYETQPIPNPVSWFLFRAPVAVHKLGVLFNHFAELVVPWFVFGPRRLRNPAGVVLVLFQLMLIVSGNLSFLNWLTVVVCIAVFDDRFLARLLPARLAAAAEAVAPQSSRLRTRVAIGLAVLVAWLSVAPVVNMLSPQQAMNASFDPLELVNTYGAFGSVGRERDEVVLQGTDDADPATARWVDYEFRYTPGDPMRRPCVVSPYQPRLDWQIWFAAMESVEDNPWLVHLVIKLLEADRPALDLLDPHGPFRDHAPRFVRARLFRYRFTNRGEPGWWVRSDRGEYLPPLALDSPALVAYRERSGWID
jgi:hypothetical protein